MVPTFSPPNACTSSSAKLMSSSSSYSSSSSSGKGLCVGVACTTSFEFEAIAGVGNAAASFSSVCVPENYNVLGFEGGEDFNRLENAESGKTFFKNSAIACI